VPAGQVNSHAERNPPVRLSGLAFRADTPDSVCMSLLLHPELINDRFGDPGLYVDLLHQNHAILIDMGDLADLPPRKILRLRHAFVSHTHMDHFCGFDRLLRILLGRPKVLHMTGPDGFIANVASKLGGYTWNLADEGSVDFSICASEFAEDGLIRSARFRFRNGFRLEGMPERRAAEGVILDEPAYRVRAVHLDHHIPCLGFAVEEKQHLNVWRTRLDEMHLGVGPWLDDLKQAIMRDVPGDTVITARWKDKGVLHEAQQRLEALRHAVQVTPGQKIAYLSDIGYTQANADKAVALAEGADLLFIESAFLDQDAGLALQKMHLTARQAGEIARCAGVARFEQFHFSPRYEGQEDRFYAEAADAAGL
jgi:ribonuclease Z